jgi:hypothetical protein
MSELVQRFSGISNQTSDISHLMFDVRLQIVDVREAAPQSFDISNQTSPI